MPSPTSARWCTGHARGQSVEHACTTSIQTCAEGCELCVGWACLLFVFSSRSTDKVGTWHIATARKQRCMDRSVITYTLVCIALRS